MKRTFLIGLLAVALLSPAVARAASLWQDSGDIYSDKKARYVGDIVTIIVKETIDAAQKSNTNVKQNEQMDVGNGVGFVGKFINAFGIEASDQYQTEGTTRTNGSLTTTISAEVVEVMPNGNLVIEARRSVVVNKETQIMVLSGLIRPEDVTKNNMVSSTSIANAQIRVEGKGQIAKRQKPGLLNKIFDWIF